MPIAALPIAIAAVLAALLVYALLTFGKALVSIIPTSGFPGIKFVHNAVQYGVNTAANAVDYLLAPLMINAVNLVLAPVYMFERLIGSIESALAETASTIGWILTSKLPALLANAWSYTNTLVNALQSYVDALVHRINANLSTLYYRALAYADAAAAAVKAYAVSGIAALSRDLSILYYRALAYADAAAATVRAYAASGFAAVQRDLSVIYARATAYADAKVAALLGHVEQEVAAGVTAATTAAAQAAGVIATDIDHAAASAIAATWPDVIAGVQGAEGAIEGGLDDILAGLKGIDLTLPKDLAGVTAFTGALAIPMLRYLEQCGIPNCRNLSQLGRDLQALLGLVEDAAFLALIVGLISDPHGTAETLDNLLTPLADDTIGAAKTLLGVG